MIATYCECTGKHSSECSLGKRLRIKYSKPIQEVWDIAGAKRAEELVDLLMEIK